VEIDAGIGQLRALIAADGGDLELLSADRSTGQVSIRLILDGAVCRECVLPREFLEPIALDMLSSAEPAVTAVVIDDPRVTG
jgi:Fe-S cluster biogenesis protein NfuA